MLLFSLQLAVDLDKVVEKDLKTSLTGSESALSAGPGAGEESNST